MASHNAKQSRTAEAYKNGLRVKGFSSAARKSLLDRFDCGTDWEMLEHDVFFLPGLFRVTDVALAEIAEGLF
jgi:hypothetical protein